MPLTILVADDDLATRLSIRDYLEMCGYLVVLAENGQDALNTVQSSEPHLLITDITMPVMDGYELVRQVRSVPAFRLLPVIFLTARTHTEERIRGYQLGCDLYLPKPFELKELGAIVRNLLERSQMIQTSVLRAGASYGEDSGHSSDELQVHTAGATEVGSASTSSALGKAMINGKSAYLTTNITQREQEVLKLIADGLSNAQIGDRLHLSPRTVEKHVSNLLRKTDTSNRAELVRFIMAHHLLE